MDPAGDFSDDEVWRAVDEAHLRQFVSGLPNDLYFECGEDGLNLRWDIARGKGEWEKRRGKENGEGRKERGGGRGEEKGNRGCAED